MAWLILAVLFTPHIPYHIAAEVDACSDHFIHAVESTCLTNLEKGNRIDILSNALCERAKAGVRVTLVRDAIGSFGAPASRTGGGSRTRASRCGAT